MTASPRVTVLTVTFNQARFLGDCIGSVQAQTYHEWEHVVIDDGSTDSTEALVSTHEGRGVRYVRKRHGGIEELGNAYNEALRSASGDLVAILDGDDYWPPWKLQHQTAAFGDARVILSWGRGVVVDAAKRPIGTMASREEGGSRRLYNSPDIAKRLLFSNPFLPASGVVIRRSALDRIGGFQRLEGVPFVDYPTWLRLGLCADEDELFAYDDEVVAYWRTHSSQVSADYRKMIIAHAKCIREVTCTPDILRAAQTRVDSRILESVAAYFDGRAAIARDEWRIARSMMRDAWGEASPSLKLRVALGFAASLAHVDCFSVGRALVLKLPSIGQSLSLTH